MITGRNRFNIYLLLTLATAMVCGCRTHKHDKDKQLATFRVHLQASADSPSRNSKAEIYRASPVEMDIEKDAFLSEAHVAKARVVEVPGGFDVQVQLNREGTWLLQEYSASNPGKHYAIFSQFGEKGKESRWLAAPQFGNVMSDGLIQFTPDASREEADQIVIGLNNIAKKNESKDKW